MAPSTERTSGKPRWKRRAEDRPDEILAAAADTFHECGFDAARVEDIARRAGLSKAAIYLYFPSKEDILRALIEREIAPVARRAHALADAGVDDPEATLRALVATFSTFLRNPRVFVAPRLVLSVSNRFPEIAVHYRRAVIEHGRAAMQGLLAAGVKQGKFRPVDPDAFFRAVIGPLMAEALLFHVFQDGPGDVTPEQRAEDHLDILLSGLRVKP